MKSVLFDFQSVWRPFNYTVPLVSYGHEKCNTQIMKPYPTPEDRIVGENIEGTGPGPRIMAAESLTGERVVNAEGELLGEITAIMLDVPTGRVAYAVLSFGGWMGLGDKLFAVPWRALQLDTDNKCFILNVPKEHLRRAPGFDKEHWPSMADEAWTEEVHRHYETRPYWE